ncbi:CotD family spore coat protein [Pueribacillus sp. YX66]|uniref:CotD family spore coat protein n=1 Tax=Pueribacillus sp. YX66 TaxID=3229242 RepID=UPI00358CDF82
MSWFPRQPRPTTLRPIVCPTRTIVKNVYHPYVVPVIHPTHTKYNHHKIYQYQHHCPHTVSHHQSVSHQHVNCNCPRCRY